METIDKLIQESNPWWSLASVCCIPCQPCLKLDKNIKRESMFVIEL